MALSFSRRTLLQSAALGAAASQLPGKLSALDAPSSSLLDDFLAPPPTARPWVYWYFMDGHLTHNGIDADLAAMQKAGLGGGIYLEVGIGVPRGPVEFMSEPWRKLLGHAFSEADRLGLEIALAAGPGWCGTGGPWVTPGESMQHLVFSSTTVEGPTSFHAPLPQPKPRTPFFGEDTLSPELLAEWKNFYRDEFVLAFPTPAPGATLADIDEKALYTRGSYSSQIPGPYTRRPWVRPLLPTSDDPAATPAQSVDPAKILDLTAQLSGGVLTWTAPAGRWTVLRFGRTLTGQTTRPSPQPGLGLESDKFSPDAIDAHVSAYIDRLLRETGAPSRPGRGLVALHFDSWEMSSQNWSPRFREEFRRRRGYDPVPLLPTFAGLVVGSTQRSERFLWDLRQTANELVCENQGARLRRHAQRHALSLTIEPYDLNPASDLDLGATADIPAGEFWSKIGNAPQTDFSVIEAVSIGHTMGRPVIAAEAFTAPKQERGLQHPASMKAQGDWAFASGINKFVYHRFQAQPWNSRFPGMTMGESGGYGVHWDRTQTWWDFVPAYHRYIARCQQMLRRGMPVADILYLVPEGAPSVFFPPRSAFRTGYRFEFSQHTPGIFSDHREYSFDGCAPQTLLDRAEVRDGRIAFPGGASYRLLVLPRSAAMTPTLLAKIAALVEQGATVLGAPPSASPSLANYPHCDEEVRSLAGQLWPQAASAFHAVGKGRVYFDAGASAPAPNPLAEAKWIGGDFGAHGPLFFRRDFDLNTPVGIDTAQITFAATSKLRVEFNGLTIYNGIATERARRVDLTALLAKGTNRIAVTVEPGESPAALVASLVLTGIDGHLNTIATNDSWRWSAPTHELESPAIERGPWNCAFGGLAEASIEQPDIYPSYNRAAAILTELGQQPDFASSAPLRYAHRAEGDTHFYFLANGDDRPTEARCRFRVSGLAPEWWNPITGEHRPLPAFTSANDVTEIPLRFDPLESAFLVFRTPGATAASQGKNNFPTREAVLTLSAPWQVHFDPRWGGPNQIFFPQLTDWALHEDEAIRHYSGKAVYSTSFDFSELNPAATYALSLGLVANIASVELNGRDLGILWCKPWRVAVPAGLLRPQGNQLRITVANLWANRQIADSALPEKDRLSWATSNPWRPTDALQPSGLLGPVRLLVERP